MGKAKKGSPQFAHYGYCGKILIIWIQQ